MKNLRCNSRNQFLPFKGRLGRVLCHRALAILCLMMTSVGAWAADYVLTYTNGGTTYYLARNGTTGVTRVNTFNPTTCIWSCETAAGAEGTLNNSTTYGWLYQTVGGTKYYLKHGGTLGLATTQNTTTGNSSRNPQAFRTNGTYVYNAYQTGRTSFTTYYINLANDTPSSNTSANTASNARPYAVEISDTPASLTAPSISGGTSVMSATGSTTFSHSNSTYTPQRTNYRFNNVDHYVNGANATVTYSWTLSDMAGYATVSNAGVVTYSTLIPERERTATLTCTATAGGLTQTAKTTIKFVNPNVLYNPSISYINAAEGRVSVTLSYPESDPDVKLYYTTNGNTPSSSSTLYTGSFEVASNTTIKVIAVKGSTNSAVVSMVVENITPGVSGGKVVLDDRQDHSWTLFQPQINGETNPIYYANPKDVKITYKANGGAVSISESADQFVYYKTLTDDYKYTTIPNPFSKRPRANGNYQGFSKWKITRISGGTITGLAVNSEVNAETELTFNPTNEYGMEVDFEVVWTRAYVVTCAVDQVNANLNSNTLAGDSYETNFIVITSGTNSTTNLNAATSKKVTITMVTPDGATDYRVATRYIRPQTITLSNDWKFEYINMNNNGNNTTITANNHDLVLGRGISNTTSTEVVATTVRGISAATNNLNYHIRMESGRYTNVDALFNGGSNNNSTNSCSGLQTIKMTLGCDYDRAGNNGANDNTKLIITDRLYGGNNVGFTDAGNKSRETIRYVVKSGTFHTSTNMSTTVNGQFYFGIAGWTRYTGKRTLIIEGGNFHSISGGLDYDGNNGNNSYAGIVTSTYANADDVMVEIQMRGGTVRGSIYGAAQFAAGKGIRKFVFTGGTINGWVAGGCNGTNTTGGQTYGSTQIYVGGNNHIVASNANPQINSSYGGNVFGAGSGIEGGTTVGQVNNSTLVLADQSIVGGNVFGGGNYGYVMTDNTANTGSTKIYVTGGTVRGKVFGGSNQQQGQRVNITMTGGTVEGGVYGGSNVTGTINESVVMNIVGGQIGTSTTPGNVNGGGLGTPTRVTGNVDLTIGGTTTKQPLIYGSVYGGSESGYVNGTSYSNTKHTHVTMNNGDIHGSLYGGGNGAAGDANVYGNVLVTVNGGSVSEAVYGCNNSRGAPQGPVDVVINGTDPAPAEGQYALKNVFGGGNAANYTYTISNKVYPTVTVNNCDNSIEYVYGGGNAATVPGTDVTIHGGNIIGNVFGGGYGANITTKGTKVTIDGGTILNVYGGSNSSGTITGGIAVNINEANGTSCPINIDNVFGGGNRAASAAGTITIGCASHIGSVYGGANRADISGDINLSIVSGHIDNVFGGNNIEGSITGKITVTVNDNGNSCGMLIGNVYGAGNQAAYSPTNTNYPVVNIQNGHLTGSVFGGGLGETAVVTGNPQVTIGQPSTGTVHIDGNVFGGGDAANVVGRPVVLVQNCSTMIGTKDGEGNWNAVGGTVYGGGNAAHVTGAGNGTSVTINGGDINRVFGGGNGEVSPANVEGNAVTVIYAGNIHQAFAGSNMQGNISGSATITVDHNNAGCGELIDEVYGGGNQAAGNAGTVTIDCGANVGDVYGGANQADINSDITLNITGGTINRVFGGNNTSGNISGAITVNVNKKDACALDLNYVYGAGNQAAYTPSTPGAYPAVNILKGTVQQDVFGGGLGATAVVTSNPTVTVNGGTVSGSVYGGGDAASVVGNTTVALTAGTVTNAFGGGNAAAINGATTVAITNATAANVYGGGNLAGVSQTATINMTGGNVTTGLYGGCNSEGTVTGDIAVNVTGGRVGTDAEHKANVHGGGYGASTATAGNVVVNVNGNDVVVYGDIYGGSALGNVNDNTDDNTTVTITAGTINGDVYGGGLGDNDNAALVNGNVAVNIDGGTVTGNVFGCNNVNGTPKGAVAVTVAAGANATLAEVYGGGNMADYDPTTDQAPVVTINGCGNTIGYVYGGGNAADVPATDVTVWGGTIGNVFGGGHGDKDAVPPTAANVDGNVTVSIKGGTITNVFAGSNSNGSIGGDIALTINKEGACEMHITDVYGGGNEAAGNAGTITIGCTGGNTEGIQNVYGGANAANITNDITLNITGGKINNVFGGNNTSGSINGGIEVNVDWDGNCTQNSLGNVYGGGNLAQYAIPNDKALAVNIKNGTVTNNVYGGGKGDANDHTKGQVTGNPVVTIGVADDGKQAIVNGDVYGGGDAGNVVGTPVVNVINKCNTQIANVYGGGNAADVNGTDVNIDGGEITGMVFGGGHGDKNAEPQKAADVNGNVNVDITGGTINKVFGGSNSKGNITGQIALNINKADNSCDMHIAEVYGGGNEAAGNAGTITIGCTGGNTEGIGDVYGGANAADINSDITLNITGGKINNVFGGNNTSGSINGGIEVNVDWDGNCTQNSLGNVYGGGNLAQYTIPNEKALAVNIKNGTVTNNVYGGGKGDASDHTKGQVTGNPVVTIGVADNDRQAIVNGDVYGGGDAGNVVGTPVVNVINKCNTQIANVYGGGNAADVSGTDVNIDGGTITGMVFGGGHGDKDAEPQKAANVGGNVNVDITGGTINKVFGGSNSKGNITGTIALNINKANTSCDMHINEVYGGGNEAAGNAGTITIGCTGGETEGIQNVYGGANAADINSNISLNITGGNINNVFGGNNTSGTIIGTITVTVDWNNSCSTNHINNVYGAGNQAPYTGSPVVNIYNCTISEDVFGGGLGSTALVTGNPQVNVLTNTTNRKVTINGSVYGGGSAAPVTGNPVVTIRGFDGDAHKVYIGNYVFGGGLGSTAVLTGDTSVNIFGNTEVNKNVYGGGNGGLVTGNTNVTIGDCN